MTRGRCHSGEAGVHVGDVQLRVRAQVALPVSIADVAEEARRPLRGELAVEHNSRVQPAARRAARLQRQL